MANGTKIHPEKKKKKTNQHFFGFINLFIFCWATKALYSNIVNASVAFTQQKLFAS